MAIARRAPLLLLAMMSWLAAAQQPTSNQAAEACQMQPGASTADISRDCTALVQQANTMRASWPADRAQQTPQQQRVADWLSCCAKVLPESISKPLMSQVAWMDQPAGTPTLTAQPQQDGGDNSGDVSGSSGDSGDGSSGDQAGTAPADGGAADASQSDAPDTAQSDTAAQQAPEPADAAQQPAQLSDPSAKQASTAQQGAPFAGQQSQGAAVAAGATPMRAAPAFMLDWVQQDARGYSDATGESAAATIFSYLVYSGREVPMGMDAVDTPIQIAAADDWFSLRAQLKCWTGHAELKAQRPDGSAIEPLTLMNSMSAAQSVVRFSPEQLATQPGTWLLSVVPVQGSPLCSLAVDVVPLEVQLDPRDAAAVLGLVQSDCCAGATATGICNILQNAASSNGVPQHDLCHLPQGFCSPDGRLTQLLLDPISQDTQGSDLLACSTFPPSLGRLTELSVLSLSSNQLFASLGEVQAGLADASRLRQLMLRNSKISGQLDCGLLAAFPDLEVLSVSVNKGLVGELPGCFLRSPSLRELFVSDTGLSGMEDGFTSDSGLQLLAVINNEGMAGSPFPASVSDAPALQVLRLAGNGLAGDMPALPAAAKLVDLWGNALTGQVPDMPGSSELTWLDVSNNRLEGGLPNGLLEATQLQYLNVSCNQLTELSPAAGATETSGRRRLLQDTPQLSTPAMWYTAELRTLDASNNSIGGEVPLGLASLRQLALLDLSSNDLSGSLQDFAQLLAADLPGSTQLGLALNLADNQLTGPLPEELDRLAIWQEEPGLYPTAAGMPSSNRIFDVSNNAFSSDSFPGFVLDGIPTAVVACADGSCRVQVGIGGGTSQFGCPSPTQYDASQLDAIRAFDLSCTGEDGTEYEVSSMLQGTPVAWTEGSDTSTGSQMAAAPAPAPSSSGGLSGGAIAGIVIGCVVGAAILVAVAVVVYRRIWSVKVGERYQPWPSQQPPVQAPIGAGSGYYAAQQARDFNNQFVV